MDMLIAGGGRRLGLIALCSVAIAASGGAAFAKHRKKSDGQSPTQSQPKTEKSSDPCTALKQHVGKRVAEIKSLQAAIEKEKSTPKTLAGVFDMLSGKTFVDDEKVQKIKVARKEAEDLNALLSAGHCPTVDIDAELAKP